MAFLSLGLHNDKPPASSEQGKNEPSHVKSAGANDATRGLHPNPNGLGGVRPKNANRQVPPGSYSSDEFEADKFEDETDAAQTPETLRTWLAANAGSNKGTAEQTNGNGNGLKRGPVAETNAAP